MDTKQNACFGHRRAEEIFSADLFQINNILLPGLGRRGGMRQAQHRAFNGK